MSNKRILATMFLFFFIISCKLPQILKGHNKKILSNIETKKAELFKLRKF